MAYTSVRKDKNGRAAIAYAEGENNRGHNGNEVRNQYVGTVNMMPGIPYADQMERYWRTARKNHKNQVVVLLMGFSENEFNPDDPEDIQKANEVGQEVVRRFYPGRQAVVFTQIDGKSGLVHNHIYINDVSLENGLACTKEQHKFEVVKEWANEVTAEFTTLDFGKNQTDKKRTRYERVLAEQGKWSWKEDLRDRVTTAMSEAVDEQSFLDNLSKNGVEVEVKDQKKHGHFYTYTLTDFSRMPEGTEQPKKAHARSYGLGPAYGYEALMDLLKFKGKSKSQESSQEGTGGGARRQQADTGEERRDAKLDFVAFTQKMLRPEEQWAISRDDGLQYIDDYLYASAQEMYQKYQRDEPFREEEVKDDPSEDADAGKQEEPPAEQVTTEPQVQEPVAEQPAQTKERTHEEKMRILQEKARQNARRAANGRDNIRRSVKRDDLSEITKRLEQAAKEDDREYE